jgi:hypothetical protein
MRTIALLTALLSVLTFGWIEVPPDADHGHQEVAPPETELGPGWDPFG